jgi:hypothetical protein
MENIILIEQYLKDLAARSMVVPCGNGKLDIVWKPQSSKEAPTKP